jgi:hypothetical protein
VRVAPSCARAPVRIGRKDLSARPMPRARRLCRAVALGLSFSACERSELFGRHMGCLSYSALYAGVELERLCPAAGGG